jgi:hypothetical protein
MHGSPWIFPLTSSRNATDRGGTQPTQERAFEMFAESVVGAGGMGAAGLSSLISDVASVADLK